MSHLDGSAREHAAETIAALAEGDNEGAADLAGQALAVFPDAALFHRLRGIALFALGANEEAKTHLAAALAVDPLDNAAVGALARLADAQGDPYTAAEHFLTAWEHDPANRDLRAELTGLLATLYGAEGYLQFTRPALAALYVRNDYPERAAREYAAILADHPNRIDLRLAAALAQWRVGDLSGTVDSCSALLAEDATIVRARWALADATARRGSGDLAREHAKRAAQLDPDGSIARELIAGNPDAAIVDPDEPLHLPARGRHLRPVPAARVEEVFMSDEEAGRGDITGQKSDTMRLVEALSGLATALAEAKRADQQADSPPAPPERAAFVIDPQREAQTAEEETPEPEIQIPHAPGLAEAIAALDAPVAALAHPVDLPYAQPGDERALAETPVAASDEPEPVIAVVEEDGAILAIQPGGEPLLDAADALPNPSIPFPAGEGGEVGRHLAPAGRDAPGGPAPTSVLPQVRSGDVVAAVGAMRAALTAAGSDHDQLHALLPDLRALADAAPQRADTRRLLGDAYSLLGMYAQAQGQYRQALLVRIAGKDAGR